jgi:hypothetical protein
MTVRAQRREPRRDFEFEFELISSPINGLLPIRPASTVDYEYRHHWNNQIKSRRQKINQFRITEDVDLQKV